MSVFAVISMSVNPTLGTHVTTTYPADNYQFSDRVWFVVDTDVTTAQVCAKLGVAVGSITDVVVVRFENYFGVASTGLWEWLKLKGIRA